MTTTVNGSDGGELVPAAPHAPSLPEKIEYARQLAESGLLPAAFRKQPANVLYAYEYGQMLGLSPMAALTGIHVIEGKPTASAALISALVRRAGHRLRVTGDDQRAVAEITRSDDPGFTFSVVWTVERAQTAGLLGKDVWKKYRPNMLKHRAVSECARDACEEALLGMNHTPEELGVDVDEDGEPLDPIQAVSTRIPDRAAEKTAEPDWDALLTEHEGDVGELWNLRALAKGMRPNDGALLNRIAQAWQRAKDTEGRAAKVGPPPVTDPIPDPATDAATQPANQAQMRRIFALLNERGIGEGGRHAAASMALERDVVSFTDLTTDDANRFIAQLEQADTEPDDAGGDR